MQAQLSKPIFTSFFFATLFFISSCRPGSDLTPTISCDDINSNTVWQDRGDGVDYILDCILSVNAKLTIEPGVVIQCNSGSGIIIETGGSLVAAGTLADPIEMKGEVDVPAVWKGLYIKSNNVLNELNYCSVSNGGSGSFEGNSTKVANIRLSLNAKLKLTNSTIRSSGKEGLLVDGLDSDDLNPIASFSNNNFKDNLNYPISAIASIATMLDGTASSYTANTNNKILLRGGRMFGSHVWQKMDIPYLIQGIASVGYYTDNGNLTIQPGVRVQFAGDAGLCTGDYSTASWMNITGTASERVTLTGEIASPGAWKGIAFQSTSPNNTISFADVSYGGSSSYTGNTSQRGNIMGGAWSAGSFNIANTTISNSQAWGIYCTLSSPVITVPASVTYTGNTSGNYYHE